MQVAAQILSYNVNRFIESCIEHSIDFIDQIYIAHSELPWGYNQEARETKINPTTLDMLKSVAKLHENCSKITIISGDWLTEESMRNDCLKAAISDGADWLLILDADEFYTPQSWHQIRDKLNSSPNSNHFNSTWYNYWKSPQYVIQDKFGSIKQTNASFALRCKTDSYFVNKRIPSPSIDGTLDFPCHHFGYVMSNEEMEEKIRTWGHSTEFNHRAWLELKWLGWNPNTRFLHPVTPNDWVRAVRFPNEPPSFSQKFEIHGEFNEFPSPQHQFLDAIYNGKYMARGFARAVRSSVFKSHARHVNY